MEATGMNKRRLRQIALSVALVAMAVCTAQAQTTPNAVARYRVTLSLLPGDSAEVISRQIAGTYRARLDPFAEEGFTGFVATMSEAAVELLRRDPHVANVERVASSPAAPSFPQPVPAAAAAPVAAAGPGVQSLQTASWSLSYGYDGSGNIRSINSQPYVYDELGRVRSAPTQDSHIQAYTYDRYGNILTITTDSDLVGQQKIGVNAATNQASEKDPPYNVYGDYDAAGNMIKYLGFDEFSYDGTGMVTRANVQGVEQAYVYTADDERIATITVVSSAEQSSEWTIRSLSGEVLRRVFRRDGAWSWDRDYIYGDGLLAAETTGPEKTLHFHLDHLGTPRLITGNGGAKVSLHHYHAFGRESSDPAQDNDPKKFTGHERDFASLDYMHARYYNPFVGRFLSPDPVLDLKSALRNPQMWSRYSYVMNNPVRYVDPDGRLVQLSGSAEERQKLLELIRQNLAQKDQKLVTLGNNGMLQIAKSAKGSTTGFSMLKAAVRNQKQTVNIAFGQTAMIKPGPGPMRPVEVDLRSAGGGAATGAPFTMSGNIEVRIDPRGSATGESLGIVMGHELMGHAFDYMFRGLTSEHSARNTENLIRSDLGLPLRPNQIIGPWPDDPEHP
jgi:RHS repeat-associated protein